MKHGGVPSPFRCLTKGLLGIAQAAKTDKLLPFHIEHTGVARALRKVLIEREEGAFRVARLIVYADQQLQRRHRSRHEREGVFQPLHTFGGAAGLVAQQSKEVAKFRIRGSGWQQLTIQTFRHDKVTAAVRGMSNTESAETLTIYQMALMTLFFMIATPIFGFVMPTATDAIALTVVGVLNGFGQYWWTRALSMAPPSAVGPFFYFSLVWAIILGYLFWGDVPTLALLAGSAIVVGSGLFLLWRESGKKPLLAD